MIYEDIVIIGETIESHIYWVKYTYFNNLESLVQ